MRDDSEGLAVGVGVTFRQEMRQEDECEQGASQQRKRGEHAEIAEQVALGEE